MNPTQLPSVLIWLVDEAISVSDSEDFLMTLGARLAAHGLPLAGGALSQAAPHPIIARRVWLWRAVTGTVIEQVGFGPPGFDPERTNGRGWLVGLGTGIVQENRVRASAAIGQGEDGPVLGWAATRPFKEVELLLLDQVARFAAAPLAVLAARSALAALLETYLGRRSAAQVLAGRLKRETGETIQAALLYADLRGFTELSENAAARDVIVALDAWFDRIAGAVHAFGGEVLKFVGDGLLAIFPIGERSPSAACEAALNAVAAARAGMAHLDRVRAGHGLPPLPFGMALHRGEMFWGNIGTADRLDFTAIGPTVNLVSRLEGLCRLLGHNVLISGAFAAETTKALVPLGEHTLRGIAVPCAVFTLADD